MVGIHPAAARKNTRLRAKVLDPSPSDSQTGVHSRRYFEILLPKEADRCRRYGRILAMTFADVDRFKDYNDAFGDPAGDDALREIACCIRHCARSDPEIVARYGGEEFAVLPPAEDDQGAWDVAESMRRTDDTEGRFHRGTAVGPGIAALRGNDHFPRLLFEQAGCALSQSKRRGRNRTVRFESWISWMMKSAHSAVDGLPTAEAA